MEDASRSSRNMAREIKNSMKQKASNIADKGKEMLSVVQEKARNVSGKIANSVKGVTNKVPEPVVEKYNNLTERANQFMESNTLISKAVFFIVMVILFVFLFNLGMTLLQHLVGSSRNPILMDGMMPSNTTTKISVNPNMKKSVPIYRSINEDQGIEFTWNVWFFVEGLNDNFPSYSRIFSKGSDNVNMQLNIPSSCPDRSCSHIFNSSPGLFITQNRQNDSVFPNAVSPTRLDNHVNLILLLNTFQSSKSSAEFAESITIENVPIKKWVCATIRVQQTTVDVYINGVMTQRKILNNVPRQNYYDITVGDSNDGFKGSISSLRYFNHALPYDEIQSIYGKGPNLKSLNTAGLSSNMMDYISMNWYYK